MRILRLISPGRLPTVIHDPGGWCGIVASQSARVSVGAISLNFHFWEEVCSPEFGGLLLAGLTGTQRLRQKLTWASEGLNLAASGKHAALALRQLRNSATYSSAKSYTGALARLGDHLNTVNRVQREFDVSVEHGPVVCGLDYSDSHELARFASKESLLHRIMEAAARHCLRAVDLAVFEATSPYDLLTAMICTSVVRRSYPAAHLCLADHGYENFSLEPHLGALRTAGTLDRFFDTIIETKDERDVLMQDLVSALERGERPAGFLRLAGPRPEASQKPGMPVALVSTFASEPILWTRLSPRRCYWDKCTFCVQNTKYSDPRAPIRSEVDQAIRSAERNVENGVRNFVFSDEAVSPAFAKTFSLALLTRKLSISWACRCKLELAFDDALFRLMRKAGCYEILFGLESSSGRTLSLMGKYAKGLNEHETARVLRAASAAGLGLHINLIGGFPGDTLRELSNSVQFVVDALAGFRNVTYTLNEFALFPASQIARQPQKFGILKRAGAGDIPMALPFETDASIRAERLASVQAIPKLREILSQAFDWLNGADGPGSGLAQELYSASGHGSIFKAQSFDDPSSIPPDAKLEHAV